LAAFSFATVDLHRIYTRVQATLLTGKQETARGSAVCNIMWRRQDRWSVVMWGSPKGPYQHWSWQKMWRTGVNVCMDDGSRYNMPQVPFSSQLHGERDGKAYKIDLRRAVGAKKNKETGRQELQPVPWNDEKRFQEEMLPMTDWVKGLNWAWCHTSRSGMESTTNSSTATPPTNKPSIQWTAASITWRHRALDSGGFISRNDQPVTGRPTWQRRQ